METVKKLNEQQRITEKIFGSKQPTTIFVHNRDGSGYITNKNKEKCTFKAFQDRQIKYDLFDNDVWTFGSLKWLYESTWKADRIVYSNEKVFFSGKWQEGSFEGYSIYNDTRPSVFNDGYFKGQIYGGKNEDYNPIGMMGPENYYTGVFRDDVEGVLGKKYLKDGVYQQGAIDLFLIPIGSYITINDTIGLKVLKALGDTGTDFEFFNTSVQKTIKIKWETIRKRYEEGVGPLEIGKPYNFPGLINVNQVQKIEISKELNIKPVLNFGKLSPKLGLPNENIELIPTDKHHEEVINGFIGDLANGSFFDRLKRAQWLVTTGHINGYGNNKSLEPVFNNIQGNYANLQGEEALKVREAMEYLGNFMFYVIGAFQKPAKKTQILYWLKKFLNIDKYITVPPTPEESQGDNTVAPETNAVPPVAQ